MEDKRRQAGGTLVVVLIAVAALAAAGFWNYRRNLEGEQRSASERPMHGYSTSDLETLANAYRQEIAAHSATYASQKARRSEPRDRVHFDEQVREFETAQKNSGRVRKAGEELSVREADLARIEEELRARAHVESDLERHLRLLVTF